MGEGGGDPTPGVAASCLSRRSDSAPHRKYLSLLRRKIFVELRQQRRCGGAGSGETRRGVRVCHLCTAAGDNWAAPSTWCLEIPLLSLHAPGAGIWAHCCHIPPSTTATAASHSTLNRFTVCIPSQPHLAPGETRHCSTEPQLCSRVTACRPTHWQWSPQPQWNDRYPAVTVTVVPAW